ncbi:hypothetical protein LPJ57_006124 [Coemansia sp. RSA 486]|nr:hypothetical protein LPJ57_006124 [Coemansia sp. RSA 486]
MPSGSVSASASASASADGLAYMGGLAISGAGSAEDTSSGILTPQTSLPQMSMSTTSTPQMLLNGQDFAFGSMSPTMMMSSVPSPLASSMPTTIAASAAAMVAASQQQQQQYFYPQNMAASAAMAAMAAISAQSPAIYPDGEYSQMVFASALSRQQQQQQQNQAAAALMGAPHLNSPPLSTSSFSAASLAGDTPPLGECLSSPYPPMCMSATTPQQQMLSFSAWPAAVTTAAAVEPMDAVSVPGQMALMLAPPLMAGIPGSPNIHGNVGLDFILPQSKPGYAAEWLV